MNDRRALGNLANCVQGLPDPVYDWTEVLRIANDHLLTPALWDALEATAIPADVRGYLATLHRLNGERNRALRRQAVELIAALNRQSITPALLKGGLCLFDGPYADPAARMMRDLDILVPLAKRDEAIAVLHAHGYRLAQGYGADHHAFGDFARPGDPGSVDLHTELVDPSHLLPATEVWQRGAPRTVDGVCYLAPSGTDRVLHNLLHAQLHHLGNFYRGTLQVQQVYELAHLARHFGPAVDWPFIEQRLRAHRLTAVLESHLLAAHRLFGLAWPLGQPAGRAARFHYRRCELQFASRLLQWLGVPWGNLRGPFAWHRMRALYGAAGGPLAWRARHLGQYFAKKGVTAGLGRLLRIR
ncbi:MAG TPA: nucleotidyltransferase family protein [Reyranella sp.]